MEKKINKIVASLAKIEKSMAKKKIAKPQKWWRQVMR